MSKNTTVVDMRKFVEAREGRVFTTSQNVADAFGKQHYHVLAKVRALDCSDHFLTHNFSWVQFEHRGNSYEAVEMTKDGFMFLVMGFTGKAAAAIKEAYIAAFNEMAGRLKLSPEALVGDLVGAVIGSSGEVVLDRVIDQKAYSVPSTLQRSFRHTMKSRLRSRFNVQRTALIPAERLADACNFVAAYVLEGEFLAKPQTSTAKVDWPASRWLAESSPQVRERMTAFQGAGKLMVAADMLYGPHEIVSPTLRALAELEKQGHNLEACRLEVMAMKHHLEGAEYAFKTLRMFAANTEGKGIRFAMAQECAV